MHILLVIIALVGAGLYLYMRLKDAGQGAGEAGGAQRDNGAWTPTRLSKPRKGSIIADIDDPLLGAAVMMADVANAREEIDAATATVIKEELRETTGADPTQALEFAIQAIKDAPDPDNVSLRLSRMWNNRLDSAERQQLIDMVTRVATMKGEPTLEQIGAIQRLRSRLDLG